MSKITIKPEMSKFFREAGGVRKPFALPMVFRVDEDIKRQNTEEYSVATVTSRAQWFTSNKNGVTRVASDTQFDIDQSIEALQAAKDAGLKYWRVSTFATHIPTPEEVEERAAQADA